MPESWFTKERVDQRVACGVPENLKPKTKPEIGLELLKRAIARDSLPFEWVAADELYGDSIAFRDSIAQAHKWYYTEIKCSSLIWQSRPEVYLPEWKGRGRHPIRLRLCNPANHPIHVDSLVALIPPECWVAAIIKEGSKGPIVCDFSFLRIVEAWANLPGPEVWLIIRRNLDDLSVIKFYFSNAPAETPLIEFVRISGMRWSIETIFEESKGEIGLDQYEMRSWLGWITICSWWLLPTIFWYAFASISIRSHLL